MNGLCRLLIAGTLLLAAPSAFPQDSQPPAAAPDVTDLAKKTQNPVGDVITVPFQFNFNTGGDLADETFLNLNLQPVIPFTVSLGLTKTTLFNRRPMNIGVQYYSNVAKPDGSAGESLRFVVALIYPQG